jgi:hypothetical protein
MIRKITEANHRPKFAACVAWRYVKFCFNPFNWSCFRAALFWAEWLIVRFVTSCYNLISHRYSDPRDGG